MMAGFRLLILLLGVLPSVAQRNYIIGLDNHIFQSFPAKPGSSVLIGNGLTAWESRVVIMGQYNEVCRFRSCNATVVLSSGTSQDDLHDAMLVMRDGSIYINVNGELVHMQSFIINARDMLHKIETKMKRLDDFVQWIALAVVVCVGLYLLSSMVHRTVVVPRGVRQLNRETHDEDFPAFVISFRTPWFLQWWRAG